MVFELQIALEIEFKFQTLLKLRVGVKGNILQINATKLTLTQNYFHVVSSVQIDMGATSWIFFCNQSFSISEVTAWTMQCSIKTFFTIVVYFGSFDPFPN